MLECTLWGGSGVVTSRGLSLVHAQSVSKQYEDMLVLDRIDLTIRDGEFVAILGPSGSGKSTLLRIITGLLVPSSGQVLYRGAPIQGPCPHAAMVFQTFALYPWLTVLENVEIGLKAKGMPLAQRQQRAKDLIDLIGLDGFEDAYPKELSGGMRQRVGFARALAVEPELLCMDEPFSALDFLTAENLRSELLDLWTERKIPTRSVLMVTHGVEEAAFMADRIIVLSRNPARLVADIAVTLPRPRNRKDEAFVSLVDRVYKVVTEATDAHIRGPEPPSLALLPPGALRRKRYVPLPHAPIGMLSGLLELIADRGGEDDLYRLGAELLLEVDDLLPVTEAAELLGLATVREGDIRLTPLGTQFAEADTLGRKLLFAQQLRPQPLFAMIAAVLEDKSDHTMPREFFSDLLAEDFGPEEVEAQLTTAIAWGRYAEIFAYDPAAEEFYLEDPETVSATEHDELP